MRRIICLHAYHKFVLSQCAFVSVWTCTDFNCASADLEAAGHPALKSHGSGWILTTFIMVAEMFGLGILTLPADFARLGWAVGLGLVLLFCLGMMYSGLLFSQLGAKVPTARVYEDFASASLGKHGRWLVYSTVYLVIFLDPIIFHLTATQSLQQIFYQKNVPLWVAGVVVSVIMLPLSQLQDIGEVALISIIGTIGMMTAVVIATLKLLMMEVKGAHHEAVHSDGFNVAIVALMDIVFTFGGQSGWVTILLVLSDLYLLISCFDASVALKGVQSPLQELLYCCCTLQKVAKEHMPHSCCILAQAHKRMPHS